MNLMRVIECHRCGGVTFTLAKGGCKCGQCEKYMRINRNTRGQPCPKILEVIPFPPKDGNARSIYDALITYKKLSH